MLVSSSSQAFRIVDDDQHLGRLAALILQATTLIGGEADALTSMNHILGALFVGDGHFTLQYEVNLLQGVVLIGPIAASGRAQTQKYQSRTW